MSDFCGRRRLAKLAFVIGTSGKLTGFLEDEPKDIVRPSDFRRPTDPVAFNAAFLEQPPDWVTADVQESIDRGRTQALAFYNAGFTETRFKHFVDAVFSKEESAKELVEAEKRALRDAGFKFVAAAVERGAMDPGFQSLQGELIFSQLDKACNDAETARLSTEKEFKLAKEYALKDAGFKPTSTAEIMEEIRQFAKSRALGALALSSLENLSEKKMEWQRGRVYDEALTSLKLRLLRW